MKTLSLTGHPLWSQNPHFSIVWPTGEGEECIAKRRVVRKVLRYKILCNPKAAPLSIVRIRAPRLVPERGLKLSEPSSQALSLSDALLGRGPWE